MASRRRTSRSRGEDDEEEDDDDDDDDEVAENDSEECSSSDELDDSMTKTGRCKNQFVNDGSFLEMFKKRMEEMQQQPTTTMTTTNNNDSPQSIQSTSISQGTACPRDTRGGSRSGHLPNESGDGHLDQQQQGEEEKRKPAFLPFGRAKRRGGRVLRTGMVKKLRKEDDPLFGNSKNGQDSSRPPSDAWAQYMAEVRKYKEQSCEDEGKTRPLVK